MNKYMFIYILCIIEKQNRRQFTVCTKILAVAVYFVTIPVHGKQWWQTKRGQSSGKQCQKARQSVSTDGRCCNTVNGITQ